MAGMAGFEPATSSLTVRRSDQSELHTSSGALFQNRTEYLRITSAALRHQSLQGVATGVGIEPT